LNITPYIHVVKHSHPDVVKEFLSEIDDLARMNRMCLNYRREAGFKNTEIAARLKLIKHKHCT
jgi:hypothetical protein